MTLSIHYCRSILAFLSISFAPLIVSPSQAQVVPDVTLGSEASIVTPNVEVNGLPADLIEGGAIRGSNLFHSFSEFSIGVSERIYFDSPENIETILSRVTGGNLSDINGLLGTRGDSNAALILMNPNGIVFGENALLDTQGAFTATTASGVQLGENGLFSAVSPERDNLLSINPSALFFNPVAQRSDISRILVEPSRNIGLFVPRGNAFSLIGGDVVVDGRRIETTGGRIVIGAVAEGIAEFNQDNRLFLSQESIRGDLQVENFASIVARSDADYNGEIFLAADNVEISALSQLLTSVSGTSNNLDQAGVITIDATGSVLISDFGTNIVSVAQPSSNRQGGDIIITGDFIQIDKAAFVISRTLGPGAAGNVNLQASEDITLTTGVISSVATQDSKGRGGDITIAARNLNALEGSLIAASTQESKSGNILITVDDRILLDGIIDAGSTFGSIISTTTSSTGKQDGGDIEISANTFEIANGSRLTVTTANRSAAGNIALDVTDRIRISNGQVASFAEVGSAGNGGNVEVSTATLELIEGGQISGGTFGSGNAGDIVVNASNAIRIEGIGPDYIAFVDGLPILAAEPSLIASRAETGSTGEGGNITVTTPSLSIGEDGRISTSTLSEGNAGNVTIQAVNLSLTDGAQVTASTAGSGSAGNILVDVKENAYLAGIEGIQPSGVSSVVTESSSGSGGSIELLATNLFVQDGAQVSASTRGSGDAGDISIRVVETVSVDGSGPIRLISPSAIVSSIDIDGEGRGGSIYISSNDLEVVHGAVIDASAIGFGDAGSIDLDIRDQILINDAAISTLSLNGSGGQIQATADNILLVDGDFQTVVGFGRGSGGDIVLSADYVIALEDSDLLSFSADGRGGSIDLSQTTLFSQDLNSVSVDPNNRLEFIALNGNERADVNATGGVESGQILINDASFIINNLAELPSSLVDTEALVTSACITERQNDTSTFTVRGSDRTPLSPTDPLSNNYSLGAVQTIPETQGQTIQEPEAIYQTADGRLLMSHRCQS